MFVVSKFMKDLENTHVKVSYYGGHKCQWIDGKIVIDHCLFLFLKILELFDWNSDVVSRSYHILTCHLNFLFIFVLLFFFFQFLKR